MDLIDRVRGGMDRAAFEANKLVRVNAVQGEINALEKQIAARKSELGAMAWEMYKSKRLAVPELVAICRVIESAEQQIAEKQKSIEAIRQEELATAIPQPIALYGHLCSKERIRLPDQAVFCPNCGSAAIDVPQPSERLCPKCGTPLNAQAVFCSNCGSRG